MLRSLVGSEMCIRDSTDTVQVSSSANWVTYTGVLPCADCAGLKVELSLDLDPGNANPPFKLKETYLATKDGDQAHKSQGVFTTLRGMKGNDDATIYQLNPDKPSEIQNYLKLNDSTLRTLDKDLNMIESPFNIDLARQK